MVVTFLAHSYGWCNVKKKKTFFSCFYLLSSFPETNCSPARRRYYITHAPALWYIPTVAVFSLALRVTTWRASAVLCTSIPLVYSFACPVPFFTRLRKYTAAALFTTVVYTRRRYATVESTHRIATHRTQPRHSSNTGNTSHTGYIRSPFHDRDLSGLLIHTSLIYMIYAFY